MAEREPAGWVMAPIYLVAAAAGIWGLWCTVIGFVGGTMPVLGIQTDGGIMLGLFMLFIGEPILLTIAFWLSMVVLMPVAMIFSRKVA